MLEALKKAGITDYTVDLSNHTVKILGFDLDNTTELEEKLGNLRKELGDNFYEHSYKKISSRYIDREVRQNIRETWKNREQNRQLHSYLTQAEKQELVPAQETQGTALAIDVNELQLKASAVLGSPQVTLVMRT